MSRSRRKSPAGGITADRSNGAFKARAARKMRAMERAALTTGAEIPDRRLVASIWQSPKDGRRWFGRQWAAEVPSILRK